MTLQRTEGPDEGSMTVVFGCPKCRHEIAMLTNSFETQMVRSLDVRIGGHAATHEPMSVVTKSLASRRDDVFDERSQPIEAEDTAIGSKCPFSGAVAEAYEQADQAGDIQWTPEAVERIERVPAFIRSMVRKGIEDYAADHGYSEIDSAVVAEVRDRIGM
jgi:hypothetical protein